MLNRSSQASQKASWSTSCTRFPAEKWTRFRGSLIVIILNVCFLVSTFHNRDSLSYDKRTQSNQMLQVQESSAPYVSKMSQSEQKSAAPKQPSKKKNEKKPGPPATITPHTKRTYPEPVYPKPHGDAIPADEALTESFNICHVTHLGDDTDDTARMPMAYQCQGPAYYDFTGQLFEFIEKKSASKGPAWGHRAAPIPAGKSFLFFGNTHTRQLALNLACQMGAEEVVEVHHFVQVGGMDPDMAIRISFRNGSSLYVVTNSYVAYSEQWQALLEKQIEESIEDFDMVALGLFEDANQENSLMAETMQQLQKTMPEVSAGLVPEHPGPSPQDIFQVYDGPFLIVSNDSVDQQAAYKKYRDQVRLTKRLDHSFINQRDYIDRLHLEGAADVGAMEVKDTLLDEEASKRGHHRCVGHRGGHPDLVAWDVADFIHEYAMKYHGQKHAMQRLPSALSGATPTTPKPDANDANVTLTEPTDADPAPSTDNTPFDRAPSVEGTPDTDAHAPSQPSASDAIPSDDDIFDHFNYCTATHLGAAEDARAGVPIWYQCEGPNYDAFGAKLSAFADEASEFKPRKWGHRAAPFPANKSVLFFGNSHTQQLAMALACQMGPSQVVDAHHFDFTMRDPNMATRIRFHNGASAYIVANSYAAYSAEWQALLEQQIEKSLKEFDVVVMGLFDKPNEGTSLFENLLHMDANVLKDHKLDLTSDPPGPSPSNVTAVYDGPLLFVSNMSVDQLKVYKKFRKQVQSLDREDQNFLNLRQFIKKMEEEGAAPSKEGVHDMITDQSIGEKVHRCTGKYGGHSDLVAWDVSEFIHQWTA